MKGTSHPSRDGGRGRDRKGEEGGGVVVKTRAATPPEDKTDDSYYETRAAQIRESKSR